MKKLIITILLLLTATSYASQKAITDTGAEVILNSDGTWEYFDDSKKANNIIITNTENFKRSSTSTFFLKSTKNNSAYWINTDKWSFARGKDGESAEYTFRLKGKDLYVMSITEGVEIPLESFTDIALSNAREAAPNAKIVKREYRVVNGKKVLCMQLDGIIQGIKFTYFGYYYSDASGCTQFIAYTASNLFEKYKSEINDVLNGLDTQ
jgi:hypothetical protein